MQPVQTISGRQFKDFAPYAVVFGFFAIMVCVRSLNITWLSGFTNDYLSVHILFELIGILVSFAVFTVGWATYQNASGTDILILSIASFAVACLDLGHTLSFTGMPYFFGISGPNKSIDFWLISRLTGSLAFLYVALSPPRFNRIRSLQWLLLTIATVWVAVWYWVILGHPDILPVFFIPGVGLTPIKVISEWALVLISSLAGVLFFVGGKKRENVNVRWMGCASLLYGMCGYFFTIYKDFDDVYTFTGHCFKAVSYLLLYRAVFLECVSRPYERVQHLAAEAEASNLAKSRFLANVSHEFRTPLGVIGGFGDLMLASGKLGNPLLGWAQIIVRNSKQLSLLIDDLLDLAKAENENIELRLVRFDLLILVEQVKQGLESQSRPGVEILIDNKMKASFFVTSDEMRLRQILVNIVGNATKFTSRGHIKISLERSEARTIEIRIEDTGIGIDPSDTDRLFLPFSQVSNPNNRRFGGTGLGLSLSRQLAELLRGELVLKWSKPNVGSCFALTFHDHPLENKVPLSKLAEVKEVKGPPSFLGRKVLVAEDSPDNQVLLDSYLKQTGIEITFADNGRLAVEFAMRDKFDMILMDIQMPEMDGFEATVELRRLGWKGQIVALTAHALQPERERAMNNGFDNYLVKPIKKETLWVAMDQSFMAQGL